MVLSTISSRARTLTLVCVLFALSPTAYGQGVVGSVPGRPNFDIKEVGGCAADDTATTCIEYCDEENTAYCDPLSACYMIRRTTSEPVSRVCECSPGFIGPGDIDDNETMITCQGDTNGAERRGCCPYGYIVSLFAKLGKDANANGQVQALGATSELSTGEPTQMAQWNVDDGAGFVQNFGKLFLSAPDGSNELREGNEIPEGFFTSMYHKVDVERETVNMFIMTEDGAVANQMIQNFFGSWDRRYEASPPSSAPISTFSGSERDGKSMTMALDPASDGTGDALIGFALACPGGGAMMGPGGSGPSAACPDTGFSLTPLSGGVVTVPIAYTHETSATPELIRPSGMEIMAVSFRRQCLSAGCWKIDVQFTIGEREIGGYQKFNVFYLPRTAHPGPELSYDYDYDNAMNAEWGVSEGFTFEPNNFPCGTLKSNATDARNPENPADYYTVPGLSACCMHPFVDLYRTPKNFSDYIRSTYIVTAYDEFCTNFTVENTTGSRPYGNLVFSDTFGTGQRYIPLPDNYVGETTSNDLSLFDGLEYSWIQYTGAVSEYLGAHKATLWLDEIEMREYAGKLTGTIGFEYDVETFVGLANFFPSTVVGVDALDTGHTQRAVTFTKTDFFFVSTHGENDYTFLSYVNLRLVEIYDKTNVIVDSGSAREGEVDPAGAANYVQVTFVIDSDEYEPFQTPDGMGGYLPPSVHRGLIPVSTVRVGQGAFIETSTLTYNCLDYLSGTGAWSAAGVSAFDTLASQDCAVSGTQFCATPASIPDQFVSFNIPIGVGETGGDSPAGLIAPEDDLSANVFVEMVVQVQIKNPTAAANDVNEQIKTTLVASVPIVEGGVNIFCDQLVAKTDLQDVVNVDIVFGSAADDSEYSRLRIISNVASSMLDPQAATQVDTSSIQAGLMTFVIKGNASYFENGDVADTYGLEIEDLITIHIMEPTPGFTGNKAAAVQALMATGAEDNVDSNGDLITTGYKLNDAWTFEVNRETNRAHLEPTAELLTECAWRADAAIPEPGELFPQTCIIRRDIDERTVTTTAYDLANGNVDVSTTAEFMQTILGSNSYAATLGPAFASLIASKFDLNGRYRRAFWINPGYEWTPQQTGGQEIFTVSQKIFLFALVQLNENFGGRRRTAHPRRFLLQEELGQQERISGQVVETSITPKDVAAIAAEIPESMVGDKVKQVVITMAISDEQACAAPKTWVHAKLKGVLEPHTSALRDVYVVETTVDRQGLQCPTRRRLLAAAGSSGATATVDAFVVFALSEETEIDVEALAADPAVAEFKSTDLGVTAPPDNGNPNPGVTPSKNIDVGDDEEKDGSSFPVGIVAGVAGGVGGLLLAAGAAYVIMNKRGGACDVPEVQQAVSRTDDLKAQLAADSAGPVPAAQPVSGADKVEAIF